MFLDEKWVCRRFYWESGVVVFLKDICAVGRFWSRVLVCDRLVRGVFELLLLDEVFELEVYR